MTLCISYKYKTLDDGTTTAFCYSDSLITTLGAKSHQVGTSSFLPSNAEIKHQTTRGIKIQIVSAITDGGRRKRDFIFSIAGAVALGLQSLIHLDSVLKHFMEIIVLKSTLKGQKEHSENSGMMHGIKILNI